MTTPTRIPELRPEIVFIFDLVRQLKEGRIRIPRFQRPFVWSDRQMIDLLDSINKQYPIGNLLTWKTDEQIRSLSTVGPVVVDTSVTGPSVYVLDGHQRLSTIAGALVFDNSDLSPEESARWMIYFNAAEEIFEHVVEQEDVQPFHFPMTRILDTFEFLEECQRVLTADPINGRKYVERTQAVARAFQNYKIPVIQINETGMTEAVEIFARLNSRGQAMIADQMVSALLYSQEPGNAFDLATEIDASVSVLSVHGFGELDRNVILRALLAAIDEDIYRTDWTRIASNRRQDFVERLRPVIPEVRDSLERAAKFLNQELGVSNDRLLPYAMQMTVLSSFFYKEPEPSKAQSELLSRWFWASSFGGWFGGANPSRVNALVRDVIDNVAANRVNPRFTAFDLSRPALPIPRSFDMRSARTRAYLLVLLSLEPLDSSGQPIIDPQSSIHVYGPEAVGYVFNTDSVKDKEIARSPANRIVRYSPHARGQARTWLLDPALADRSAIWESHGVPTDAGDLLARLDGSAFLYVRLAKLAELERQFMEERSVQLPPTDDAPVNQE